MGGHVVARSCFSSIPPGSADEALARTGELRTTPAHVAIIMDGNGRWRRSGASSSRWGHRAGINSVRDVLETSARIGIEVLTLYAFWSRTGSVRAPKWQVLMALLKRYIRLELPPRC